MSALGRKLPLGSSGRDRWKADTRNIGMTIKTATRTSLYIRRGILCDLVKLFVS
jgi:hypothetical protein